MSQCELRTEKKEPHESYGRYRAPFEEGPHWVREHGQPDEQETAGVPCVGNWNRRGQKALAAAQNVLKGGQVGLHLLHVEAGDPRILDDV